MNAGTCQIENDKAGATVENLIARINELECDK